MITWSYQERCLPLKFPWKIARGTATEKIIFKLTVSNGEQQGEGEIAFNVRYGESADEMRFLLNKLLPKWPANDESQAYDTILEFFDVHGPLPCSLRTGMETAWVHYLSAFIGKSVPDFLKSRPLRRLSTSFSLPILEPHEIEPFFKRWSPQRFKQLKIKLDANWQLHAAILDEVQRLYKGRLRLDYNEAFKDPETAITAIQSLKGRPIEFIEQPLPAGNLADVARIKQVSPFPLFADEDVVDGGVGKELAQAYHGINVKLMKSGGYFKALKQMREARQHGLQILLGCMVETSLGIACAMMIAGEADYWDLDGMLLLAKDPEGLVVEEDGMLVDASVH